MAVEYCSFCGIDRMPWDRKFEMHHIARFVNNPLWTCRVCSKCHRIWNAWHYSDRNKWDKTATPRDSVRHHAMLIGQMRCIELLTGKTGIEDLSVTIQGLARDYIIAAATDEAPAKPSNSGAHPKPTSLNPSSAPAMTSLNYERVLRAQAGIEAYLYEERQGVNHPVARLLRLLEMYPLQVGTAMKAYRASMVNSFETKLPSEDKLIELVESVIDSLSQNLQREYERGAVI